MQHPFLFTILVFFILLAAFFSAAETGMMCINRYRLRHFARKGNVAAKRISKLLERPDRLLGVILIGSTFANVMASALATIIAIEYWGDIGIAFATIGLTLVILIFGETAPKTLAALYPERVAFPASLPLHILLKIVYPLVWAVNGIANNVLRIFGVKISKRFYEPLSIEELRTLVNEASGKISTNYQQMLLRILDLEQVSVQDVMVPRNEIYGIDLEEGWDKILNQLVRCSHSNIPLYRDNIEQAIGMLNLRKVLITLQQGELTKQDLLTLAEKVYFVPESASLSRQLLNFQENQKNVALVVDEYGDIQGLVTLQDVLEEIVGEFSLGVEEMSSMIKKQKDGSVLVDGQISIRDLIRQMHWHLPIEGPKTLSGLIMENLEMIPTPGVAARIAGYPMEVIQVSGNKIRLVKVWPKLYREIN